MPAADGAEAETIAQARVRAGAALHEVHRAVTAADHETIALKAPGVAVARAHAAVGDHPGFPCTLVPGAVSVYVVPAAPRGDADWDRPDFVAAPQPDPGLLSQVRAALSAARLLGEELFVREPRYRAARLRVEITGTPRDPAAVRSAGAGRAAPVPGPADRRRPGAGWPFGAPLRPSALLRVAQQAAGHDGDVSRVAIALDDGVQLGRLPRRGHQAARAGRARRARRRQVRFSPGSRAGSAGGLP